MNDNTSNSELTACSKLTERQCLEQCSITHCAESCFKLDGHAGKHLCALHRIVFEGPLEFEKQPAEVEQE
jgi:hypothetical protein